MSLFQKIAIFFCCIVVVGTAYAIDNIDPSQQQMAVLEDRESETPSYPLKKTKLDSYEDLTQQTPIDLKNPSNVKEFVEYDPATGLYFFRNQVGDMDVVTPFAMNEDEYMDYSMKQSMRNYWQDKVRTETEQSKAKQGFSLTDMQIDIGKADKIFGPGGVQVKMQGSAELLFGFKINRIENPTLSVEARKPHPIFDFDEKIQLNINGKVGDRVTFGMNYNTEASFDYDQSVIKLAYQGKEDDIIKSLEAGNVSLPLNSSLIRGSSALFGIKTEMQFGRLSVAAVVSQQETETKTVSLKNGKQTTRFELNADQYDENRHFFLAHFFRDNFEKSMSKLPYINSGVQINRIEAWITNKKADFTQARNIVAYLDLAESKELNNTTDWTVPVPGANPSNSANTLYQQVANIPSIRNIQNVNSDMAANFPSTIGGEDYEKVESARRLDPSEYTLNQQLGYISLKSQLNADEVLAVAFEYTYQGKVYQVGEFSTDGIDDPNTLILKLLKGTNFSPGLPNWDLMMKNVYSLGAAQVEADKFRLDVLYQSDSTGIYLNYIPEGNIKNQNLLKVMKLDRLDRNNALRPDGDFDFIDGFTINAQTGRVIFPVLEPFGSDLGTAIGNPTIAQKYVYQELYDSTKTTALEYSEKNKFKLKGEYRASTTSEIRLNAYNVPKGSVTVRAGGMQLTENIDYTVDYMMGTVNIINQAILESGNTIDVSLESQSMFSMQRKTLLGTHLEYQFNKDFSLGGTIMHLSEKPLTTKVNFGEEPISNTIWGLNFNYRKETQWLTNVLDKIPILTAKAPSSFVVSGEFAHLIPGHSKVVGSQGETYLDDFESSTSSYAIQYPYSWFLASTPRGRFPEATLSNNIEYGKNRALLAWYTIDPLFTRTTNETPDYIRNDKAQQSNHFVREIPIQEIFPNRELVNGQPEYLPVLNLAYYPTERGPYNLDADNINPNGSLRNPKGRWGGIMRRIDVPDFEAANVEFVEFWLMDPFVYNTKANGGDLYFNLGEISEDILKDGKKSFENGLDPNGDFSKMDETVWGYMPKTQPVVNAFDNNESSRQYQDVGLNGLRTEDEFNFPTYKNYVEKFKMSVSPTYLDSLQNDQFSPLNDPAGDNYQYFRSSYWDNIKAGVLDRYKRYNGMEGNSPVTTSTGNSYSSAATSLPNAEDINQDNNLNEYEKYLEYKISLRPNDMVIGQNYIVDKITSQVKLKDGTTSDITWYQFKIPVRDPDSSIGSVSFKSVRFMRMYMTDFDEETHLRFGTMELVRGDWTRFKKPLYDPAKPPAAQNTSLDVSIVNIEENATKKPVNYVLPPGIEREQDPSQTQVRQENEQSLLLKVTELAPGDARAVYKNTSFDMRQFKRLQMFAHAEKFINDNTNLENSELTAFIRIGSDLTENYYEYEIPLQLTPEGIYNTNNNNDRQVVWPAANTFDFPLSVLTNVKSNRNTSRRGGSVSFNTVYSEYDPDKPKNKVTVLGNPSLSDVQTIMIGVRNQSRDTKSGEIWVDELRLSGFDEDGGYAALANATLNLSDIGSVSVGGRIETVGFGGIEDNVLDRRMDDFTQVNVATNLELGRFFPEKAKLRLPMYYSYSREVSKPKYDPTNQDLLLSEVIADAASEAERDSISDLSNTVFTTQSFNLTNVKVDIRSERPMFYDPANFSLNYAYSESKEHNPEIERNITKDYRAGINYAYSFGSKPWEPFKKNKTLQKPAYKLIGDFNVYYLPASIGYSTSLARQYTEKQLRNLNNPEIDYHDPNNPLLSNGKNFLWNRKFDLKYDLTKAIKLSFTSASNAQIEETKYSPVNKDLFPDEYQNWKDTVWTSLRHGGTPLTYQQDFTLSWNIPINKIPVFSWINSNFTYDGRYTWDRGALTEEDEEEGRKISSMGNLATSLGTWQLDGRFNFEELYNKSSYLKSVNQKYSSRTKAQPRKVQRKVILTKDKPQTFRHQLNSERVKIVFTDTAGVAQKIAYKVIDKNSIEIQPTESATVTINVEPGSVNPAMQLPVRILMMVRNLSFNYVESNGMIVNGFMPESGFFGQDGGAPGVPFALGYQSSNWIKNAHDRNWLANDSTITPITQTYTSDLTLKMGIEPIPGLKIDLAAARNYAEQTQIQYQFPGMPTTQGGSFSMTTIAIGTFFSSSGSISDNYHSDVYETFKANRAIVQGTLNSKYIGTRYPSTGFFDGTDYAGQEFDPENGSFSQNSADVLIPAFLGAYTGSSLNDLDLIPSFFKMLPNWRVSYDGLSRIDWIKKRFKSVTLTHAYTCKYNIAGFSSYANWVGDGNLGYVPNVIDGKPTPSGMYDVPAVSITENFAPLIRVDMTMQNSIMFNAEYRKGRMVGLNIASTQLVESANNEFIIGAGYRIADFDLILKLKNDKEEKVKNDLTLRLDLSFRNNEALIRKIDDDSATQATSGENTFGLQFSAEYIFSSKMTFRAFYDRKSSKPLISSSYPTTNSNFGISVKILLTR
jgi:cell surface protein SprA